jgi:hypothetical protein
MFFLFIRGFFHEQGMTFATRLTAGLLIALAT